MNAKLLNASKLFLSASVLFLFTGCNKNTIIFENGDETGNSSGKTTLVTFNASVEGRNHLTRAMSPMEKGIQNRLFAFKSPASSTTDAPVAEGLYITSSPGILIGTEGYKMYLDEGVYNFYAVSDNFSTIPPVFRNGRSEPLFNGIDYLWWHASQQDVTSAQINIPIVYLHAGTQVVFEVTAGDSLKLDRLVSATITPPEPGESMDLQSGIIPPASTYGPADKMGINGFLAQYIMLPLKTDTPMLLTLEIMANGETSSRTYNVKVQLPDGELKQGDSYLFSTVINENSVVFPSVSVKYWTDIDETGKPLYPTEINSK